jgi:hypothetical protein
LIHYLSYKEIDKARWDSCLLNSVNGMIYGTSWYLDQLSPDWEGLIMDDYKAVMPLPVKHKWGITYLIRPAFCQQLGIFCNSEVDIKLIDEFIQNIPFRIKWINMPLNEGNYKGSPGLTQDKGINYLLSLQPEYAKLGTLYVQNTKRNLAKSKDRKIIPEYSDDIKMLINLKLQHAFSNLSKLHINFLKKVFERYNPSGNARIVCVMDESGKMMAGAFFIHYRNRWIYLLSASSAKGKENRAMFSIVDKFIRDHAGQDEFLDFEGSMIPELARFFVGFGALPNRYPILKQNHLPFPLNLIKK